MSKIVQSLLIVLLVQGAYAQQKIQSAEKGTSMAVNTDNMKTVWWEKARFGMFIHWGVYAVPAGVYQGKDIPGYGEWIMNDAKIPVSVYKEYAKQFNPTDYDPEQWVLMAKEAGMKYIVVTTKHHDGFALFDSKASDWNVVKATPYGKDLIRPLVNACRKHGMKVGFYYSQANDWVNKGGSAYRGHWDEAQKGSMDDYIDQVAVPQAREILTNYGDVIELWWDVPTDMTKERAEKFLPLLALQPDMLTNDRLGGGIQGNLKTPEQYIPKTGLDGLWESCMTINRTWGFKSKDETWKSTKNLIRNLIETASKGGNYLLNVGPDASGKFPEAIVQRLKSIGDWMKINSEAIYDTKPSPFKVLSWGRVTTKLSDNNSILYLHVYEWPKNGDLVIPGLKNAVVSAQLLSSKEKLKFKKSKNEVVVIVPSQAPDENASVIKLLIKGKPDVEPYIIKPESDGSIVLKPGFADVQASDSGSFMKTQGESEDSLSSWTDSRSSASWQIWVEKPGLYDVEIWISSLGNPVINLGSGSEKIRKEVTKTGNYNNYEKINLGKLKLEKAGLNTIVLSGEQSKWHPVNVRKIVLSPESNN